jgi:hypothetical protein
MTKTALTWTVALAAVAMVAACAETKPATGTATTTPAGMNVKINPAALARASQPPPANATATTTAGHGNTMVNTANSASDTDPTWIESLDIDMDGKADSAEYTWDDEDKVTYIYSVVEFPCVNGSGTFKGGMLTCVWGASNTWGKPAGSGWYVSELNAGQCAAESKALWGCHFNALGEKTECGWATITADKDDIVITAGEVKR